MNKNISFNNSKICAVVCEYNPFHNGHLYQLDKIRRESGCDLILCVMSGNFVQRGEAAILDKHTRAKHAVLAGADCVVELPLPFATANAETFALGAISLLKNIPNVTTLAFGCECGHGADFLDVANVLLEETDEFKRALKTGLDVGQSFAKARFEAVKAVLPEADERLFSCPNNVLGIEYTKAILRQNANISVLPIQRTGAGYTDTVLQQNYSSATAIRGALLTGNTAELASNLPEFVLDDLCLALNGESYRRLDGVQHYALLTKTAEEIAKAPDCTEGLENKLQALAKEYFTAESVLKEATSKRYTSARIRRILLANALGITQTFVRQGLQQTPYCKVLALRAENSDMVLSLLANGGLTLLTRKGDEARLTGWAKECFDCTHTADGIYNSLCGRNINFNAVQFI